MGPQLGPLENEYPETRFLSGFADSGSIRVPSRALFIATLKSVNN